MAKQNGKPEAKKNSEVRVRTSPAFKLKDKQGRFYVLLDLKRDFGFIPEKIIIEKMPNYNNTFVVRAILTEDEIKKENEVKKNLKVVQPKKDEPQSHNQAQP